jgi:hypothetical protein
MGGASAGGFTRWRSGALAKVAIAVGIVALVGALAVVVIVTRPAGTAVQRHDDRLRRLETAVCESDPSLPATTVGDCRGTIDAPPTAPGCQYTLEVELKTAASEDQLVSYYSDFPAPEDFGDHLFRPAESATVEQGTPPGGATVRISMVGDALGDPRCA